MLRAAELYTAGKKEMLRAMRTLKGHPDFRLTERQMKAGVSSREALTMAHWLHQGLASTLNEGSPDTAGEELRRELRGGAERDLRLLIEDEERVLAARAAKRRPAKEVKLRKAA